eukprot:5019565-Amphidinium_carterae.1
MRDVTLSTPVRVPVRACHAQPPLRCFVYCKHSQSRPPLRQNGRVIVGGLGWHIPNLLKTWCEPTCSMPLKQRESELDPQIAVPCLWRAQEQVVQCVKSTTCRRTEAEKEVSCGIQMLGNLQWVGRQANVKMVSRCFHYCCRIQKFIVDGLLSHSQRAQTPSVAG